MPVIRAYNPFKKKRRKRTLKAAKRRPIRRKVNARKARHNPGADKLVVFMPNPHKGRKRSKNPRRRYAKRRNPSARRYAARGITRLRHHSRRKNPLQVKSALTNTLWVGGGAIATRSLTQIALSSKNQGAIGYLANGGVAVVLGFLAERFDANAGNMVLVGGLVATLLRIVQEKLMPAGAISQQLSLQGLGDASFALGDFIKNYAVLPSHSIADSSGNMVNDWQGMYGAIAPFIPPPPAAKGHSLAGYDYATGEGTVDRLKSRFE